MYGLYETCPFTTPGTGLDVGILLDLHIDTETYVYISCLILSRIEFFYAANLRYAKSN